MKKFLIGISTGLSTLGLSFLAHATEYPVPDASSTATVAQQGISAIWTNLLAFLNVAWIPLIALAFIYSIYRLIRSHARV